MTQIAEPVYQYDLFDDTRHQQVVNVASVPQRSPFRYPGGKTWLVPHIRRWFASFAKKPVEMIEPFAGGGTVSLTVAFEGLADCVQMVEMDAHVAAVWQTVLNGRGGWLAEKIASFDLTPETLRQELSVGAASTHELAFQTILRNRVNHGGILAPGSGVIKHGENGKGLSSRWYPETLKRRILDIQTVKEKIQIVQGDGLEVLRQSVGRTDVVFFIDPPYTAAGKKAGSRLYAHNALDHEELFAVAASLKGEFLMTYDNAEGVLDLARRHGFAAQAIAMKNTHHAKMTELLISRRLDWV